MLSEFISKIAKDCPQCGNSICCKLDLTSKQGYAHKLCLTCDACQESVDSIYTSNKTEDGRASKYEVNVRMVAFVRSLGKGNEALELFSTYMNSPQPMNNTSYKTLLQHNHAANRKVAFASMSSAGVNVKSTVGGDGTVSVDGTWQRRGHVSHHGVVTAISTDTGKCLDVEVLSNICHSCITWEKEDKQSDKYLRWKADHKCSSNHGGSAGSMESVGASRMFLRSQLQHDLRYVNYLGDGDSSSFKCVNDSKPYGEDCCITKMECIGHVQKRVGSRLRKLKTSYKGKLLSDGKGIRGTRRLTKCRIDTLQNYFGLAIRQNVGDVITMQRTLM